jgi:hypothetical protein
MRKARDEKLAAECRTCSEGMRVRKMINDQHDQAERDMMVGYLRAIKMHIQYVNAKPWAKDFKWSKSEPPQSPHKERIAPPHTMARSQYKEHMRKKQRAPQVYNGCTLLFWND